MLVRKCQKKKKRKESYDVTFSKHGIVLGSFFVYLSGTVDVAEFTSYYSLHWVLLSLCLYGWLALVNRHVTYVTPLTPQSINWLVL